MKIFYEWIGEGEDSPSFTQMCIRGFLVFIIALTIIRLSGRRAFGMHSPFDNVISILLGAILSKSVIGGCPFFSPVGAALVISMLHLIFAWISTRNDAFGKIVKGKARVLYSDGKLYKKNMSASFISQKDLQEAMRKENVDSLEKIKSAYMERDGSVSIVKKE